MIGKSTNNYARTVYVIQIITLVKGNLKTVQQIGV